MAAAWVGLGLALFHLGSVLLFPSAAEGSAGALARGLLACLVLPVPGLGLALLLLRARRPDEPVAGAFTLLALSVGFAMVIYLVVASVLRATSPPVTALPMSVINLALAAAALAVAWLMRRTWRVVPEAGLNGPLMLLALALVVILLVATGPRILSGSERMVALPLEVISEVVDEAPRLSAERGGLRMVRGAKSLGGHRYVPTARTLQFALKNSTDRPLPVRLAMVLTGPVGAGARLHKLPNEWCGLKDNGGGSKKTLLSEARVNKDVLGTPVKGVLPRFNALLAHYPTLAPGEQCFELKLVGPAAAKPGLMALRDISHEQLGRGTVGNGEFFLVEPETAECHLSDLGYRQHMLHNQLITPQLLLWGYFTQFVVQVLAGSAYPAVGLLFLMLALFNYAAGLVLLGCAIPGPDLRPRRRLAGLLLLGPLASHVLSLVLIRNQSFGFPDGPYTFFLMGALVMLVRGQRVGFILLGCLAAYARYPGAYVLAVALFTWLALEKGQRRWTLGTIGWAVAAGLGVVGMLLLHYHTLTSIQHFLDAVYFEIFPEHFEVMKNGPPAWLRVAHFWLKLLALACLTPLLWPLARTRIARLLMVITVAYGFTLMSVHVAHSHYFQLLIYASAVAGISALGRLARGPKLYAAVGLVLVGSLACHALVRLAASSLLGQWGIDWPLGLR